METRQISSLDIHVSLMGLGTWAFGGDIWWGPQQDGDSVEVLETALEQGVTLIDTAPVYGRGRSESVIGAFLEKRGLRSRVLLATKLGLSWQGRSVFHDLSPQKMRQEIDESRQRLRTDYIDIYQVHWPDPKNPVEPTAGIMYDFYQKGIIRAVGVSNYSLEQIKRFMAHCPLHSLQPPYNMFMRDIEKEIIPFCRQKKISLLTYVPLHSGILTGKFFLEDVPVPDDLCRKNKKDLREPYFSINRDIAEKLRSIADSHGKSLSQLVLNWTANRPGVSSVLVGSRRASQVAENAAAFDFAIRPDSLREISDLLDQRQQRIAALPGGKA